MTYIFNICTLNIIVQELGKICLELGLRVVSYVKFTQDAENPFIMIIYVDLRYEMSLQSEVPPY